MTKTISLEKIMKDTLWIVKYNDGGRKCCVYAEIGDINETRDTDIAAEQPEHLKEFYKALEKYEEKNGWVTVQEFYPIWIEQKGG